MSSFISPEQTQKAKEMDALTYLINYEPYELVKLSAGNYCTKTHDSLKLSNGKWYWWSKGIGGRSAVDYLMAVKDLSFYEAVKTICDCSNIPYRLNLTKVKAPAEKKLIIPEKSPDNKRIKRYLKGRGISENVIKYCIENNLIYECESTHAVVFIGSDENGIPRYAGIRSTNKGTRYVGDTTGSDKQYTFRLVGSDSKTVHFFEGSVDLLSYATLLEMQGKDWKQFNLVTLAGIYNSTQFNKAVKIPITIQKYLSSCPDTKTIYFHFDNDTAGKNAAKALGNMLSDKYTVVNKPVPYGKDVNDYLCRQKGITINQKHERNEAR